MDCSVTQYTAEAEDHQRQRRGHRARGHRARGAEPSGGEADPGLAGRGAGAGGARIAAAGSPGASASRPNRFAIRKDARETAEEAAMRALIEREVVTPEPDEATCLRFYEQNRAALPLRRPLRGRAYPDRGAPQRHDGASRSAGDRRYHPRQRFGPIRRCSRNSRAAIPTARRRPRTAAISAS